jgi:hypothetical protein
MAIGGGRGRFLFPSLLCVFAPMALLWEKGINAAPSLMLFPIGAIINNAHPICVVDASLKTSHRRTHFLDGCLS